MTGNKEVKTIAGVKMAITNEGNAITFHALTVKKMLRWEAEFLQKTYGKDERDFGLYNFSSRRMTEEELEREKVRGTHYLSTWQCSVTMMKR